MHGKGILTLALAGFAALALPARADTTIKSDDGSVEITVPNGWRQTKTASPKIQIQATNGRAIVLVRTAAKEDYKDLKSFANISSSRFMKRLVDAEPKTEDVQVNGKPAIRVSAEGTEENGLRRGCILTFMDAGGTYIEVLGLAKASTFGAERQEIAEMAGRVKVLAAAGNGPAAQTTPSAPAANPPPGRSPSARSPK